LSSCVVLIDGAYLGAFIKELGEPPNSFDDCLLEEAREIDALLCPWQCSP